MQMRDPLHGQALSMNLLRDREWLAALECLVEGAIRFCGAVVEFGTEPATCELMIQNKAAPCATLSQPPWEATTRSGWPLCSLATTRDEVVGPERAFSLFDET